MSITAPSLGRFNSPPDPGVEPDRSRVVWMSGRARVEERDVQVLSVGIHISGVPADWPPRMSILVPIQEQTIREFLRPANQPSPRLTARIDAIRTRIQKRVGLLANSAVIMRQDRRAH